MKVITAPAHTRTRGLGRVGVVAAIAATTLLVGVPPASASPPIGGFTVRPSHSDAADPATRAYFKRTVAAGGSFGDRALVGNTSDTSITVIVSPVDGLTGATSGAVYANRQDKITKAARG